MLDSIVGEDESGEFVQKGEVVKFSDFIVTEIDALKEVEGGAHVFNE